MGLDAKAKFVFLQEKTAESIEIRCLDKTLYCFYRILEYFFPNITTNTIELTVTSDVVEEVIYRLIALRKLVGKPSTNSDYGYYNTFSFAAFFNFTTKKSFKGVRNVLLSLRFPFVTGIYYLDVVLSECSNKSSHTNFNKWFVVPDGLSHNLTYNKLSSHRTGSDCIITRTTHFFYSMDEKNRMVLHNLDNSKPSAKYKIMYPYQFMNYLEKMKTYNYSTGIHKNRMIFATCSKHLINVEILDLNTGESSTKLIVLLNGEEMHKVISFDDRPVVIQLKILKGKTLKYYDFKDNSWHSINIQNLPILTTGITNTEMMDVTCFQKQWFIINYEYQTGYVIKLKNALNNLIYSIADIKASLQHSRFIIVCLMASHPLVTIYFNVAKNDYEVYPYIDDDMIEGAEFIPGQLNLSETTYQDQEVFPLVEYKSPLVTSAGGRLKLKFSDCSICVDRTIMKLYFKFFDSCWLSNQIDMIKLGLDHSSLMLAIVEFINDHFNNYFWSNFTPVPSMMKKHLQDFNKEDISRIFDILILKFSLK
ncbi:uncharacterized protein TRIADDRAFT_62469 [Trichoplax adhaerens]|uniref:Uncharacterized protein n=1 Tax=Trichoplax adhaerens TaxID=10228 RepID=B3SDW4_TRIAD|nr:predicted protein [Trichoplax adhaerens]EDV19084.1 predicted protein [Trichoplax adhaerens]|eukprot:XP_002118433.1 predicted protein [Trichoplax adhaerens]